MKKTFLFVLAIIVFFGFLPVSAKAQSDWQKVLIGAAAGASMGSNASYEHRGVATAIGAGVGTAAGIIWAKKSNPKEEVSHPRDEKSQKRTDTKTKPKKEKVGASLSLDEELRKKEDVVPIFCSNAGDTIAPQSSDVDLRPLNVLLAVGFKKKKCSYTPLADKATYLFDLVVREQSSSWQNDDSQLSAGVWRGKSDIVSHGEYRVSLVIYCASNKAVLDSSKTVDIHATTYTSGYTDWYISGYGEHHSVSDNLHNPMEEAARQALQYLLN